MSTRKRLASWDLYSLKGESIVHLLLPGRRKACGSPYEYIPEDGQDTLEHNMHKRPCPDCLSRQRSIVAARKKSLDDDLSKLSMFEKLRKPV